MADHFKRAVDGNSSTAQQDDDSRLPSPPANDSRLLLRTIKTHASP